MRLPLLERGFPIFRESLRNWGRPYLTDVRKRRETSMGDEMVLLRVVDDTREGWNWMPFDQFLEQINLASWKDGQELVGMVLPHRRPTLLH